MLAIRPVLLSLCGPIFLVAQSSPVVGLQPQWDIGVLLGEMSAHASRLLPVLDRLDAGSWIQKGASETYAVQLQSSKDQARTLRDGAKTLALNPEKLSACLELYFRVQALEQMTGSLVDGARKYQNGSIADELAALSAENGTNRDRFQTYIVNLATEREQECAVMDREAQRCRSIVATQPPSQKSNRGKKK
jgi:hypothetical protein